MEEDELKAILHALVPRVRAGAAMVASPWFALEQDERLRAWLLALPFADDAVSELNVALAVDGNRLRWSAAGPAEFFIPVMGDFFSDVGADPAAVARLNQIGAALDPPAVGHWLEARPDALNAGWYFPFPALADEVLPLLPDGEPFALVRDWIARHHISLVGQQGAAVGGSPFHMLELPLPGDDVERQMFTALQLFAGLQAEYPPDDALEFLLSSEHRGLSVSLWLTDRGVVKAGIIAHQPERLLSLDLAGVAGITDLEPLARVEGSMLVDEPVAVEAETRAGGFGVALHYDLLAANAE